ncbi:hypothetical protein M0804_004186 [Polistes exclamans]|nr:hypothetical protein M0804_004186 [Polistes exclamans]
MDPGLNATIVKNALLELKGGVNPNHIAVEEIRVGRRQLGETVVTAPLATIQAALNKGRNSFGWCSARVVNLRQRPLQCHRCLARGHVAAGCPSAVDRSSLCYRYGRPDHVARNCVSRIECMVCKDAGRKTVNHRAGSWECPVVPPRKTGAGVFVSVSERSAGVPVSANARGDGPSKGPSSGSAQRTEEDHTMVVDQVDLSIPTRGNGKVRISVFWSGFKYKVRFKVNVEFTGLKLGLRSVWDFRTKVFGLAGISGLRSSLRSTWDFLLEVRSGLRSIWNFRVEIRFKVSLGFNSVNVLCRFVYVGACTSVRLKSGSDLSAGVRVEIRFQAGILGLRSDLRSGWDFKIEVRYKVRFELRLVFLGKDLVSGQAGISELKKRFEVSLVFQG